MAIPKEKEVRVRAREDVTAVTMIRDPAPIMNPLNGKSASVFTVLEARFAEGHYKFGDLLSAADLAAEFRVSLQPIRSAIGQLRALGYVKVEPQIGCRVASPAPEEISDFFCLFGRMEGTMAAFAAKRCRSEDVDALYVVLRQIEGCRQPEHGGLPVGYAGLVGDWHAAMRGLAQSPALAWRMRSFWLMSDFLLYQGAPKLSRVRLATANAQRKAISDAIRSRDAVLAERLMQEHVQGKPIRVGIVAE